MKEYKKLYINGGNITAIQEAAKEGWEVVSLLDRKEEPRFGEDAYNGPKITQTFLLSREVKPKMQYFIQPIHAGIRADNTLTEWMNSPAQGGWRLHSTLTDMNGSPTNFVWEMEAPDAHASENATEDR
jgi:hypothetical protein